MFLARGTEPGALASFGIVAAPDESVPIVHDNPLIANTHSVFNTNIFNDPTPDGLYGYRMELPSGPIGGLKISISELTVTTKGLSSVKSTVTCLKKRHGTCVKRKVKKTTGFWLTQQKCPGSRARAVGPSPAGRHFPGPRLPSAAEQRLHLLSRDHVALG